MTKSTIIAAAALLWLCHPTLASEPTTPRYELLLKGGHVIDPANEINEPCDVAVQAGKIAAVAPHIAPSDARRVVEVDGLYVTPGIIDLHAHCIVGRDDKWGFPPDMYLASGVTTVVDAGTYGAKNFSLLRHYVMEQSKVRVLAFLNIVAAGMGDKEQDVGEMDPQLCAATIAQYPDLLVIPNERTYRYTLRHT